MQKPGAFIFLMFLSLAFPAFAGGPILRDKIGNSGEPARWPYDPLLKKWVVNWYSDPGSLTNGNRHVDNVAAIKDWVKPLFERWKTLQLNKEDGTPISTTSLQFVYRGNLNDPNNGLAEKYKVPNVDVNNYELFTNPDMAHPPPPVVIFDVDGSIIKDYYDKLEHDGAEKMNGIAGLGMSFPDSTTKVIRHGFVILNGRLIDGISDKDNAEISETQFKAVVLHELGHLLNLDHTQINLEIAEGCSLNSDCAQAEAIPNMYPELRVKFPYLSPDKLPLHRDDKVTLSWLYPSEAFSQNFCTIVGEIQDKDGKGMQGVNVIARNSGDSVRDARSMVSGALYPGGTENGKYVLAGIVPNQEYEIIYEELASKYAQSEGSTFEPLGVDSPTGFGSGTIAGQGGDQDSVHCSKGGQTITIPSFKVVAKASTVDPGGSVAPSAESKGWCSLNVHQEAVLDPWLIPFIILYLSFLSRKFKF